MWFKSVSLRGILIALAGIIWTVQAQAAPEVKYGSVELSRDSWGTPHVFSDTDEGALYGLGYASAEDRLFQMCYNRMVGQGRLAEFIPDLKDHKNSAAERDKGMRTLGYYRAAKRVAGNLDAATQALLEAFSQGVNDYIAENKDDLHYLFEKFDFQPEPWVPADSLMAWWLMIGNVGPKGGHVQTEFKPSMFEGREMIVQIDDDAAVVKREDVSDEWVESLNRFMKESGLEPYTNSRYELFQGPKFSHGWVIGGKHTSTGAAMLVSDPQIPVGNPSLWYEFHISGKTLHARGIGFPGSPGIFIGYTPGVAWGGTALPGDQEDIFLLETNPDNPNQYMLDGEWVDMEVRTETIKVKGAEPISVILRESYFGPVISELCKGLKANQAAAKKSVLTSGKDRDTVQAHFKMMRARSVEDFVKAIPDWRSPELNCFFGDTEGNIGYWALGAFPLASPKSNNHGTLWNDGTSKDVDWQGMIPYEFLPHVINPKRGYIVSANDRPIQSFYGLHIGGGTGWGGETLRGLRIKERIKEHLATGEKFTPEVMMSIQADSVQVLKREVVRLGYHIRDTLKGDLPPEALKTLEYLEPWFAAGGSINWDLPGTELAEQLVFMFRESDYEVAWIYGGGGPGLGLFAKTVRNRLDKDPQAQLKPEEAFFVGSVLAEAWKSASNAYGDDSKQWRKTALAKNEPKTIGYYVNMNGLPSLDPKWDVKEPYLPMADGNSIVSQRGQSYTQFVPMDNPDSAQAMMPIGSSERPDSPFRLSTWADWSKSAYHPAPLSREKVAEIAVVTRDLSAKSD